MSHKTSSYQQRIRQSKETVNAFTETLASQNSQKPGKINNKRNAKTGHVSLLEDNADSDVKRVLGADKEKDVDTTGDTISNDNDTIDDRRTGGNRQCVENCYTYVVM